MSGRSPVVPRGLADALRINHGTCRGWVRHLLALGAFQWGSLRQFQVADPARARRLVFVCLGNINRSAFAAAVAQRLGAPAISIGLSTTTGASATAQAITQGARHGVDLQPHRATARQDYHYQEGDMLLVMEVRHARWLLKLGVPASAIAFLGLWGAPCRVHLHDPHTLSADYFASCFLLIEGAVKRLVAERESAGT